MINQTFKIFFLVVVIYFVMNFPLTAQSVVPKNSKISTANFRDCSHHWYDIKDEDRVIDPMQGQKRYKNSEIRNIANNILLFQKTNGGWPKNYDMLSILNKTQREKVEKSRKQLNTTFDNGATHSHVEYLAKAFNITKDKKYKNACLKGIDFILSAQYANGGWPQYYPEMKGYSKYITFNDGAMIGVMKVLQNIIREEPYYNFVDKERRQKVKAAYEKGIRCILQCQIIEKNSYTIWCQQHDEIDLHPRNARTFEPASKCSEESSEIVLFLMEIENPSKEIIDAVNGAVEWFKQSRIQGIKVKTIKAPEEKFIYHTADFDRVVVEDPKAPTIWTRYYELQTNRPMFCNRDGHPVYTLAEVQRERRTGYMWYNYAPQKVIDDYPAWQKKWHITNSN